MTDVRVLPASADHMFWTAGILKPALVRFAVSIRQRRQRRQIKKLIKKTQVSLVAEQNKCAHTHTRARERAWAELQKLPPAAAAEDLL